MLQLLGAKFFHRGAQLGIAVAQFVERMLVMAVDFGLDGCGARHCGARSHRGGHRAERKTCDVPEGLEGGRPHPALDDHRVEEFPVPLFLFGHMRDFARHRVAVAHHRELAGIDARRAIFAGLVDADHRCGALASHAADVVFRRSKVKTIAAAPSEKIALKPASEMPSSVHWAVSQRISGAFMIASSDTGPADPAAQGVIPSQKPYSTPA